MRNKLQLTVLAILAVGLILLTPSMATAETEEALPDRKAPPEARQQMREERIGQRCERISERIDQILEKKTTSRDAYSRRYEAIENRVQNIVERLDGTNVDTTEVELALANLVAAQAEFRAEFSMFAAGLENAKSRACGDREGDFVNAVKDSRQSLKQVREEAKEMVRIARTDLREALQDLREEL